jgi:hypothetical protein
MNGFRVRRTPLRLGAAAPREEVSREGSYRCGGIRRNCHSAGQRIAVRLRMRSERPGQTMTIRRVRTQDPTDYNEGQCKAMRVHDAMRGMALTEGMGWGAHVRCAS